MGIIRSILVATVATLALGACGTTRPLAGPTVKVPTVDSERSTVRRAQRVATLADSIQVCKVVQRERHIPISCLTTYVKGRPTMLVGFADASDFDDYGRVIAEYVAGPFCDAANRAGRQAFVAFALNRPGLMKLYACETGEMTGWLDTRTLRSS